MIIKRTKLNRPSILYIYALVLFLIRYIIIGTSTLKLEKIISYAVYGVIGMLLLLKLAYFLKKISIKTAIWILIFLAFGVAMSIQTRNPSVIFIVMFLILANDVQFTTIARYTYITIWITCVFVVLLSLLGIIENRVFYRDGIPKYALGFIYVGTVNNYYLHCVILRIFEKRSKIKWNELFIYFAIAFMINSVSHVRGDFYLTIIILLLSIIYIKWDSNFAFDLRKKIWKVVALIYMPVMCLASFYITMIFTPSNSFLWKINTFLSDRLRISNRALFKFGFSPMARQIEWIGTSALQSQGLDKSMYNYVDNGFIQVGIEYGLLFLSIIIIAYSALFYVSVKNENKFLCLWILTLGIECIIYPNLISIANNLLVIYSVSVLIGNSKTSGADIKHSKTSYIKPRHYRL